MRHLFDAGPARFATASLASAVALGVTAQLGHRRSRGRQPRRVVPRRLHQLSFVSSLVFIGAAAHAERRAHLPAAAAHALTLLAVATLPLTSAGRSSHIGVATGAVVLHGAAVAMSRDRSPGMSQGSASDRS